MPLGGFCCKKADFELSFNRVAQSSNQEYQSGHKPFSNRGLWPFSCQYKRFPKHLKNDFEVFSQEFIHKKLHNFCIELFDEIVILSRE